jgi:hypothetical protein
MEILLIIVCVLAIGWGLYERQVILREPSPASANQSSES